MEAGMASDPIRILIVDDDEDVLIALERLLEGEGYATATAWSGREALALSQASKFDLLLVDEHLGDVEAATLWEALQQHQPHAFRFLMHSRKSASRVYAPGHPTLCKWEHGEVTSKIRSCLAA
jgi:CheY-like chemotaxis protein